MGQQHLLKNDIYKMAEQSTYFVHVQLLLHFSTLPTTNNQESTSNNRTAEDIMDQCCHLSKFVGTVTSIRKICQLREGITFIKDFLNKFVNPLGIYPFNTFGTTDYFPHLLKLL